MEAGRGKLEVAVNLDMYRGCHKLMIPLFKKIKYGQPVFDNLNNFLLQAPGFQSDENKLNLYIFEYAKPYFFIFTPY